ncbi:hypothetical protein RI065_01575 [Mycoplasmatota bacterium zrk1]
MKKYVYTLLIGYFFAFVVEIINMGIGKGLWIEMVFTVLIFYGAFILIGYWYANRTQNSPWKHFVIFGVIGLLFEWFIFGMNPWSGGNFIVVLLIQLGMFSHWATVTFAPRLLLDKEHVNTSLKRRFLTFYIIGMGTVYILGFLTPHYARWSLMILGNIIVYTMLLGWYIKYINSFYKK